MKNKIALIGTGNWGKNHLRNLLELEVLHSVYEPIEEIIIERKKSFPDAKFVKTPAEILDNTEISAVVIAAPAALHYDLSKQYLESGKDVFVEKPLALNVKEGEELLRVAQKNNRIIMVGHILQYHSAVLKLKELVDSGYLGEIRYIYSNRLNIGKLRTEENVLWSFAPHDISLIMMLMNGEEPQKVTAFGGAYVNKNIYDTTMTTLEFKNNVKGHIFVNWLHPFKEQKLVVVGSEKMAVFDDVGENKLMIYPHKIDFINGQIPVAQKAESYPIEIERNEPLKEELLHFVHSIKTREKPRTDGNEGLLVLKVLELAQESLEGR